MFQISNAISQNLVDIQKKLDSLEAEKNKIIRNSFPQKIEKLQNKNDSLKMKRQELSSLLEELSWQIINNENEIISLKKGLPYPTFQSTSITSLSQMPLKSAPELTSDILYWIPENAEILVLDYVNNEWIKIQHDGKIGYLLDTSFDRYPDVKKQILKIKEHRENIKRDFIKVDTNSSSGSSSNSNSHVIRTGPKDGHYYINSNGNKTYIKKK
ncbi:hypothetical protein GCM10011514_19480 [Emticicia aquatilis]|uniref:SH3 domain-containing protein n=1 Tax=Emticicia aquatilis TaxID=1537369 RepID=A0A916YQP8_9BACT|nr:hypothetical protein GCM10011514_19480 [Emticicia aquatilis]